MTEPRTDIERRYEDITYITTRADPADVNKMLEYGFKIVHIGTESSLIDDRIASSWAVYSLAWYGEREQAAAFVKTLYREPVVREEDQMLD